MTPQGLLADRYINELFIEFGGQAIGKDSGNESYHERDKDLGI